MMYWDLIGRYGYNSSIGGTDAAMLLPWRRRQRLGLDEFIDTAVFARTLGELGQCSMMFCSMSSRRINNYLLYYWNCKIFTLLLLECDVFRFYHFVRAEYFFTEREESLLMASII